MISSCNAAGRRPLRRDPLILGAAIAAAPFFLLLASYAGFLQKKTFAPALTFLLWYGVALPIVEELAFRGGLQGVLASRPWGARRLSGITLANILTSIAFSLAHIPSHPLAWAAATVLPSLVFGHFRDRYGSVALPILLHSYYNLAYFWFFV